MHKITKTWVEQNAEQAGKLLCEVLGWELNSNGTLYKDIQSDVQIVSELAENLNNIHEAEKAVIEKVGKMGRETYSVNDERYGKRIIAKHLRQLTDSTDDLDSIFADAPTRLTALLWAMGITEVENEL